VEALCIEMGEVRKVGGVRDSLACATRLPGTLVISDKKSFQSTLVMLDDCLCVTRGIQYETIYRLGVAQPCRWRSGRGRSRPGRAYLQSKQLPTIEFMTTLRHYL
jgi:hypothetical protein